MRIGILTYHRACNFGANLQALSTLFYFRNHGFDPVFLNWSTEKLDNSYRKNIPEMQYELMVKFQNDNFPMTRHCTTEEEIASVIKEEKIEAIVIGSDAVLQIHPFLSRINFPCRKLVTITKPDPSTSCPNAFWGSFYAKLDKKIPLCLMSVSSQNSPYKSALSGERRTAKVHLLNFSYVSTRDDWTARMVRSFSGGRVTPEVTPDPVFAFNYNVDMQPTENEIRTKYNLKGKYALFCFHNSHTVSHDWLVEIQDKMSQRGVECVALPFPKGVEFEHPFQKQIDLPLSPLDWYSLIRYAAYYIGDNMHPIVISLHNSVPCFSFDHYGLVRFRIFVRQKTSKIYHILNEFGLSDNVVSIKSLLYREPSVDYVLSRLDSFDKTLIRKIAADKCSLYFKMMSDIEQSINQSIGL